MSDEFDPSEAAAKAMGEATDPDVDAAVERVQEAPAVPDVGDEESASTSRPRSREDLRKWALEPASKSHRDVDSHDFLDLEEGGRNRIVLVLSDYLGSDLPPRIYQFGVGLVEELFALFDGVDAGDEAGDDVQEDATDDGEAPPLTDDLGV